MSAYNHVPYLSCALNQAQEVMLYGETVEHMEFKLRFALGTTWGDELIASLNNLSRISPQAYGDLLVQATDTVAWVMTGRTPLFTRKRNLWTYPFAV